MRSKISFNKTLLLLVVTQFALSGCLDGMGDSVDSPTNPDDGNPPVPGNNAPVISGAPGTAVQTAEMYSFTPNASDADGDTLTFTIQNLPRWATFDSGNGSITGMPALGDEGTYADIRVSVTDGMSTASLTDFSIVVSQTAPGSVTLTWNPPTQNTDGSALTNLAGYRIYYGVTQGNYPNEITINNPGVSSYVVENLSPNTYYFVSTSVNSDGRESGLSGIATQVVN